MAVEPVYEVKIKCSNCNEEQTVKIKKGILITTFVVGKECPNCGCQTMRYYKGGTYR